MQRFAMPRHPPGWLALAVMATAMAVFTWPSRLDAETVWQTLRTMWQPASSTASATRYERAVSPRATEMAGGFDLFSRATGTPLPVLATIVDPSPQPPGTTQIVRCNVRGHVVYADNWSACPRGTGQLFSLAR